MYTLRHDSRTVTIQTVGPYRILSRLGAGAMGVVFLAEDARLSRRVALKTLLGDGRASPDARRRLLREARLAAQLATHRGVATVFDVVESTDAVHVVMEYVPGETLAAHVRRHGALAPKTVTEIGIQLADAVAHAHGLGVIHRDLKLANVMLTPDSQAKILDFGLARATLPIDPDSSSDADVKSPERRVAGTPGYMAPETLLGHAPSAQSDVYSLGVMLFEMVTGRRPFEGHDLMAVGMAALTGPTPRAADLMPGLPSDLDDAIARAMARKVEDRFASAAKLAAALRSVGERAEEPTRSVSPTPSLALKRPWPRVGVPVALVTLALASVWVSLRPTLSRAPASTAVVAVLPIIDLTGDPGEATLAVGVADVLITTLSRVPGVTMVSRGATLKYRGPERNLAAIATELGATLVVEGVLQRSGDKVRMSISLLNPQSRFLVWSQTFDAKFDDVLDLQSEVGSALARALHVSLTPEQRRQLDLPLTTNIEALADYAQGQAFLDRSDVAGNVDHGIRLLRAAIDKDHRFVRAYAALGRAYWQRFKDTHEETWADSALLETTEALRLDPDDPAARLMLASIYRGRGRTDEALEEARYAIRLQPGADEAHNLLGQMLAEQGQREEGAAELRQAIALRPNYWEHHYRLGVVMYDSGWFPEAMTAFSRVIELQPDSSRGFLMLGTTQHAAGDLAAAIASFERAAAVAPDAAVFTNLGVTLSAAGRWADAATAFQKAVELQPNSATKYRNLGDAYAALGDAAKATVAYARAVELCRHDLRTNPKDARVLSMLAVYEAKLGRHRDASTDAERAIALGPEMADVVYRGAVVRALGGDTQRSMAVLEKALSLGYSPKRAAEDSDLEGLKSRAAFQRLLEKYSSAGKTGGGL